MLFGGPAATRWRPGSAAAHPWQRHASLVTRPSLVIKYLLGIISWSLLLPSPRLIAWSNRKCCKRTLATNCVPGYGWQATMALQDRLSKPEVRHYCYQRPLLCVTGESTQRPCDSMRNHLLPYQFFA